MAARALRWCGRLLMAAAGMLVGSEYPETHRGAQLAIWSLGACVLLICVGVFIGGMRDERRKRSRVITVMGDPTPNRWRDDARD